MLHEELFNQSCSRVQEMLIYHATKQYILPKIPSVIAGSKGTLGDIQRVLAKLASYDKSLYILLVNFVFK